MWCDEIFISQNFGENGRGGDMISLELYLLAGSWEIQGWKWISNRYVSAWEKTFNNRALLRWKSRIGYFSKWVVLDLTISYFISLWNTWYFKWDNIWDGRNSVFQSTGCSRMVLQPFVSSIPFNHNWHYYSVNLFLEASESNYSSKILWFKYYL